MKKKSFKSLPKKAQKAAFAEMQKDGTLWHKHPVTNKRIGNTKAQAARIKAGLQSLASTGGPGSRSAKALLNSLKKK